MWMWCTQQGYAKKIFLSTLIMHSLSSASIHQYDALQTTEPWVNPWVFSWTAVISFILCKPTHLRAFQDQYNQSPGYNILKLRHTCICWFHLKNIDWLLTLHPPPFRAHLFPSSFSCAVHPSFRILCCSLVLWVRQLGHFSKIIMRTKNPTKIVGPEFLLPDLEDLTGRLKWWLCRPIIDCP